MRTRRTAMVVGVVLTFTVALTACGDDESDSSKPGAVGESQSTTVQEPFPPNDIEELKVIFDPMLEPMGLRLTRGALIDRTEGGYEESDTGNHLALYVEPIDDESYTTADYVAGVYDVTALITPYVFDRWTDIETYDICQEPPSSQDDGPEPFPESQVEIARAFGEGFNWEEGDLADLLREDQSTEEVRIITSRTVMNDPDYQAAREAARADGATTETVVPSSVPPATGNG